MLDRMVIFCPTCNRSSTDARFIGEFCEFCTADRLRAKIGDRAEIFRCKRCGRIKVKGHFVPFAANSLGVQLGSALHLQDCAAKAKGHLGSAVNVEFTCKVDGSTVSFEKRIRILTRHEMCPTDYKISSGYYEALIQIRGDPERCNKMSERITRFITRKGAFISRTHEVPTGIDMYVSDKILMNQFFAVRKMKPKKSFKLQSVRNGRELYSNIYLVRV